MDYLWNQSLWIKDYSVYYTFHSLRCDAVVNCFVSLNIQSRHLECQLFFDNTSISVLLLVAKSCASCALSCASLTEILMRSDLCWFTSF